MSFVISLEDGESNFRDFLSWLFSELDVTTPASSEEPDGENSGGDKVGTDTTLDVFDSGWIELRSFISSCGKPRSSSS